MKPSLVYKKLFSFCLIGTLFLIPVFFSGAQSVQELQNKIDQKSADIEKLEKEIKLYQGQLDNLGKQKSSLNVSIQQLDITKKKLNADISVTQNKIDKTNFKIQG